MTLSDDQILRQKGYTLSLLALERLYKNGILTAEEYRKAACIVRDKYKPIIYLD